MILKPLHTTVVEGHSVHWVTSAIRKVWDAQWREEIDVEEAEYLTQELVGVRGLQQMPREALVAALNRLSTEVAK